MLSYQIKKFIKSNNMSYIIDSGKYVMLESAWSSFSINQSQKCVSLLYVFPENSLTALDSPKTEKEIKVCCKCLKSRINNVSLKWSLCNCYLTCALPDGGWGGGGGDFVGGNVTKFWLGDESFPRQNFY